jgi:hypothetical protein
VTCAYHPSYIGRISRRMDVQVGLDKKKQDAISKITGAKRAGDVVLIVEHLFSKG